MKVLLFGSTGMLGQALVIELKKRNVTLYTASRENADFKVDFANKDSIETVLYKVKPDVIINTVANVNLQECENNPSIAYMINARAVSILAEYSLQHSTYLIQISTDHYYLNDHTKLHDELYPVRLVNEYARTKYAGECFALSSPKSLVIRTNIVGYRNKTNQPTFVEWVIKSLTNKESIILFNDFYTSSISVTQLSVILYDLLMKNVYGIFNIASKNVFTKQQFVQALSEKFDLDMSNSNTGSIHKNTQLIRADSLGLNVEKVEHVLGYEMPNLEQVVQELYINYQEDLTSEI